MKKVFKTILKILTYEIIIVEVLVLAFSVYNRVTGGNKSLFGLSLYVIATPSMQGTLDVGDIILNKDVTDVSQLKEGDIITYNGTSGSYAGKLITHQVESIREDNGTYYLITKGTNNDVADPEITGDQVVSQYVCTLHVLTFLYGILSTVYGFILLIIVPIALIIFYEIVGIFSDAKGAKDDKNTEN